MTFKKAVIALLALILIFGAYKIYAQTTTDSGDTASIENIRKVIGENTPDFIAKPLIKMSLAIENFRSSATIDIQFKKEALKTEIEASNSAKNSEAKEGNFAVRMFKNIGLFFLTILFFAFSNKLAFYLILVTFIFLILRYIWDRVF